MIVAFDHIVLAVTDVEASRRFYQRALGMEPVELEQGRWALRFGSQMIALRQAGELPAIASGTKPGSGNFCVLTDQPVADLITHFEDSEVTIVLGPVERTGAAGRLMSVYFHDPDGNLVEVATPVS